MTYIRVTLILIAISTVAAFGPATAAVVYECNVDRQTIYQDSPCGPESSSEYVPSPDVSTKPISELTFAEIHAESQAAEKRYQKLKRASARDADQSTRANTGLDSPQMRAMDEKRIKLQWEPQLKAETKRLTNLRAEVRSRCPRGAALRPGRYICYK